MHVRMQFALPSLNWFSRMSLKSAIAPIVSSYITGEKRLNARRTKAERKRARSGARHVVEYFHQVDDPYSHLTAQILGELCEKYDIELHPYLVSPPKDWAAPEREQLVAYSRKDAQLLADKAGLTFHDTGSQPPQAQIGAAETLLAEAVSNGQFVQKAAGISAGLWDGSLADPSGGAGAPSKPAQRGLARSELAKGDKRRSKAGHYLGGTFHYAGEWYWGIDRLGHLEDRLASLSAQKTGQSTQGAAAHIYTQPVSPRADAGAISGDDRELHYYLSFRSPYTYIATQRAKDLADAYGCTLKLRFVLPMVMRGLPVPGPKRMYITLDVAREARRLGVPFGRVADPLGRPVERGYSLLPWAIDQGRGFEFAMAFMRNAWSQGIDMGSDKGLRAAVEEAGLSWQDAQTHLDSEDWRVEAENNRLEMSALGLWGVPCLRFKDVATWGQDRFWIIEDALREHR